VYLQVVNKGAHMTYEYNQYARLYPETVKLLERRIPASDTRVIASWLREDYDKDAQSFSLAMDWSDIVLGCIGLVENNELAIKALQTNIQCVVLDQLEEIEKAVQAQSKIEKAVQALKFKDIDYSPRAWRRLINF